MKRIGNLWPAVIERGNLVRAFHQAARGKRRKQELRRLFKDQEVLYWLERIVRRRGRETAEARRSHSHECAYGGHGLPIGSLTSQHLANYYLSPLDRFCQSHPAVKAYCRYMDDFVCWGDDKAAMISLGREIQGFVETELGLTLKHPPCPQPTARGMDFLGYRIFPSHAALNRRSKVRYWRRLRQLAALHEGCMISARALQERLTALTAFVLPVRSYRFRLGVLEKFRSAAIGLEPGEPGRQL